MSKMNLADKVKLTSYNEMFGLSEEAMVGQNGAGSNGEIQEIRLSELHVFHNHPFRVLEDEKMEETVESVKEHGILVPGICRKRPDGGYEILSGNRRKRAAELAGLTTMPMVIKDVSDDEAVVIMVDANIQREDILPSEKAKAYAMKYEALKHQGKGSGRTDDLIGKNSGESARTVQRFIQLSKLSDGLLNMVDEKTIGLGQGAELSFLDEVAQSWVYETLLETKCSISGVQAAVIKAKFKENTLSADKVWEILNQEKPKPRKVVFNAKRLDSYFAPNYSSEQIEELIIRLLDDWKAKEGGDA